MHLSAVGSFSSPQLRQDQTRASVSDPFAGRYAGHLCYAVHCHVPIRYATIQKFEVGAIFECFYTSL